MASFPSSLKGRRESLLSTVCAVFSCNKIPWLLDISVQRLCYDDVDVMTSLLFETSITYGLQHLGCKAMTFKPHQRASVRYVYVGKDIFLLLPTGFGKSPCYEVLPFLFDVMQCSVTLHSLTAEVHQVLRCSLQLSYALCANVLWQTIIFSYS